MTQEVDLQKLVEKLELFSTQDRIVSENPRLCKTKLRREKAAGRAEGLQFAAKYVRALSEQIATGTNSAGWSIDI